MILLAQAAAASEPTLSYLVTGIVVVALTSIVQLALATKQLLGGNKGERQIEPTQLHAIVSELKDQTKTLGDIKVDVGVTKAQVAKVDTEVTGLHARIGGVSRDLAANIARVEGLERREGHK